jgi:hypothetical protein
LLIEILKHGPTSLYKIESVEDAIKSGIGVEVDPKSIPMTKDAIHNACNNYVSYKHFLDPNYGGMSPGTDIFAEYSKAQVDIKQFSSGRSNQAAVSGYWGPEGTTETCILDYSDDDPFGYLLASLGDDVTSFQDHGNPPRGDGIPRWYGLRFDTRLDHLKAPISGGEDKPNTPTDVSQKSSVLSRLDSRDAQGADYETRRGIGIDRCDALCSSENRCIAYTFDKWNNVCFLKSNVDRLRVDAKSVSGFRDPALYALRPEPIEIQRRAKKGFPDVEYSTVELRSFDDCAQKCLLDKNCSGFNFHVSRNACGLIASPSEYVDNVEVDIGYKIQTPK